MGVFKRLVPAVVISSALLGQAAGQGFGGVGNIFFLHTTDYRNAGPDDTVGCLDDNGWFINSQDPNVCGTYTVSDTISTRSGRCSFQNPQAPANPGNPNPAGRAFSCGSYVPNVGIEFYAPAGFNYTFLFWGDGAYGYEVESIPAASPTASLWQANGNAGHPEGMLMWTNK